MKLTDIDNRIKGKLSPVGWAGTVLFSVITVALLVADIGFVLFAVIFAILAALSFAYARQSA